MKICHVSMLACITLLWAACSKSSNSNPIADKIAGKWKNTRFIADSNGNHVIDSHDAVDTINSQSVIEYYPNGNGAVLLNSTNAGSFTWELVNNNTYLKIIYSNAGSTTTIQHIDSLSASAMILRDTTGSTDNWQVFVKQ